MKEQHKTLQHGTGVGKEWTLMQSIIKAQYVMNGCGGRGSGYSQYGGQGNRDGRYQNKQQQHWKQGGWKKRSYM